MIEVNIELEFKAKIYTMKPPTEEEQIKLNCAEVYLNYRLDLFKDKLQKDFQRMWDNQSPTIIGKL